MLDILSGEEGGTKCHERQDRLSIVDITNRYLSPVYRPLFTHCLYTHQAEERKEAQHVDTSDNS